MHYNHVLLQIYTKTLANKNSYLIANTPNNCRSHCDNLTSVILVKLFSQQLKFLVDLTKLIYFT